jgi:hypothetical protein
VSICSDFFWQCRFSLKCQICLAEYRTPFSNWSNIFSFTNCSKNIFASILPLLTFLPGVFSAANTAIHAVTLEDGSISLVSACPGIADGEGRQGLCVSSCPKGVCASSNPVQALTPLVRFIILYYFNLSCVCNEILKITLLPRMRRLKAH